MVDEYISPSSLMIASCLIDAEGGVSLIPSLEKDYALI